MARFSVCPSVDFKSREEVVNYLQYIIGDAHMIEHEPVVANGPTVNCQICGYFLQRPQELVNHVKSLIWALTQWAEYFNKDFMLIVVYVAAVMEWGILEPDPQTVEPYVNKLIEDGALARPNTENEH